MTRLLDRSWRASPNAPVLFNGLTAPASVDWKAGVTHRLRFINITANDVEEVTLARDSSVQDWHLFAKTAPRCRRTAAAQPARLRMVLGDVRLRLHTYCTERSHAACGGAGRAGMSGRSGCRSECDRRSTIAVTKCKLSIPEGDVPCANA